MLLLLFILSRKKSVMSAIKSNVKTLLDVESRNDEENFKTR